MDDHFKDDGDVDRKPAPAAEGKKEPVKKRTRRKKSKKPKDMPRRPLSAYNIFFREERGRMLKAIEDGTDALEDGQSQGLFSAMGKSIAKKWKALSKEEMVKYTDAANEDLKRYRKEMDEYQIIVTQRCRTDDEGAKASDSPVLDQDLGQAAAASARGMGRANQFDTGPSAEYQQRGLSDFHERSLRNSQPEVGPFSSAGTGLGLSSQYGMGGSLLANGGLGRNQDKFSDAQSAPGPGFSGSLLETSSQLGISAPQLVQYLQEEALKRHLQRERQLQLQILLQQQQQQQQQQGSLGQLSDDYPGISNLFMQQQQHQQQQHLQQQQQQQQQSSRFSQPLLQQMLLQQQMAEMGGRASDLGLGSSHQQGRAMDGNGNGGSPQYSAGGEEEGSLQRGDDNRQDM